MFRKSRLSPFAEPPVSCLEPGISVLRATLSGLVAAKPPSHGFAVRDGVTPWFSVSARTAQPEHRNFRTKKRDLFRPLQVCSTVRLHAIPSRSAPRKHPEFGAWMRGACSALASIYAPARPRGLPQQRRRCMPAYPHPRPARRLCERRSRSPTPQENR